MRTQSESNVSLDPNRKQAGVGRLKMKFLKIWGGNRTQARVDATSTTDGQSAPENEEPRHVEPTFEENLEERRFSEASKQLIERERRLFGEKTEADGEEDLKKLAADHKALEDLILQTFRLSLSKEEVNTAALASAVRAIYQEEEQDLLWQQSGRKPVWRPSSLRELHDSTLRSLVVQRMENPSTPPTVLTEQSSLQVDMHSMGWQLKEDLLVVVEVVNSCYPSEFNICQFYASLYHQTLCTSLLKITDFVLGDEDCSFLLRWVNQHYPRLLQMPQLSSHIDAAALGKLLSADSLEPLEHQFLNRNQSELMTYITRVLEEAQEKWSKGVMPVREDGCFCSPVAYDIIQLVNGIMTTAANVVGDWQKALTITSELPDVMQRFKIFHNDIMKQNNQSSRLFVKANLGSIHQFREFFMMQNHLFYAAVQGSCLSVLTEMKISGHMYLLSHVHKVLKPHYRKLGTSDWLNKSPFEKLLISIETEMEDLQGSAEFCHQELVGQLHQEVITEYVKRLLNGDVRLKGREQQLQAFIAMKNDAESLNSLFIKQGSREDWLMEVLTMIAGVLKLQDLPAIQMQVVSLATAFPDLSEKHISALLKLKTNLSKADRGTVKEILSDTLRENNMAISRPFFSRVHMK